MGDLEKMQPRPCKRDFFRASMRKWSSPRNFSPTPVVSDRTVIQGCATSIGQSCPTGLPIVVEFTTVAAATDSDDRIGTTNGPEHSGAFEPGGDERFAARFDHS